MYSPIPKLYLSICPLLIYLNKNIIGDLSRTGHEELLCGVCVCVCVLNSFRVFTVL